METLWNQLTNMHRSIYFWIGDAAMFGTTMFGDDHFQFIEETLSPDLIMRCEKVSRAFPPVKRNPRLSWTHHQLAASIGNEILAASALRQADQHGWNTSRMRQYVKELAS